MRRDLIVMGSIAAIAGIALAALLTASFGARSSGPPATLRPTPAAAPAVSARTEAAQPAAVRRHPLRTRHRQRHRREHPAVKPAHSAPSLTVAQHPATPQSQPVIQSEPTQTVSSPAPAPAPVKPLSRPAPKRSSPSGASFDDSG
jgi:hypothetical protein